MVINLLVTFNDVAVSAPDTFTSSNSLCPLTSNPINVPTDVMFVCAAVCNVPDNVVAVTPAIPVMFVELSPAILPLAVISPETVRALRVPKEVTFVCAAVCNVPDNVVAVTPAIPVIFVELSPAMLPLAVISPETVRALKVPTEVTFVCAAVCNVPDNVVAVTPAIPVICVELSPAILPLAVMSPETVNALRVPTEVTFVCAAVCNVPLRVVAVTPAIPVMFVELSPTILPLAVISPETVSAPNVPTDVC